MHVCMHMMNCNCKVRLILLLEGFGESIKVFLSAIRV